MRDGAPANGSRMLPDPSTMTTTSGSSPGLTLRSHRDLGGSGGGIGAIARSAGGSDGGFGLAGFGFDCRSSGVPCCGSSFGSSGGGAGFAFGKGGSGASSVSFGGGGGGIGS